jgi:1,4-dihydroxy-2-naphthoate polyprenyltransferase
MTKTLAWIKASRFPAQAFIFPSLLFGQVINFSIYRKFSWTMFALIHIYGLFMHLFIVYANDYADYETDKLNKTYTSFTGGSRVLVEGTLTHGSLLLGAVLMAMLCVVTGIWISIYRDSWLILILVFLGLLLLYSYSFHPIKISYRGFGEVLQMIGVGMVLPLIGYISQGGTIHDFPWRMMLIILPSQLAMAISTSLPDEPSDRLSFKRTTVVILGQNRAKFIIVLLYIITLISVVLTEKMYFLNLPGWIYIFLVGTLILWQAALSRKSSAKPGSMTLFYVVLLSILTNTIVVIGVSYLIFIHA